MDIGIFLSVNAFRCCQIDNTECIQVGLKSCLGRKYLFGLCNGAQNPPEFFIITMLIIIYTLQRQPEPYLMYIYLSVSICAQAASTVIMEYGQLEEVELAEEPLL
jgi:hypothetical protein